LIAANSARPHRLIFRQRFRRLFDLSAAIDLSSSLRVQQPATEQPGSAFLGTKLDFTGGQLQLYRFRLDKAPFNSTLPRQPIDAGGIKLKWNW
jgi:hypothetical protein